jgi:hypothetical protein
LSSARRVDGARAFDKVSSTTNAKKSCRARLLAVAAFDSDGDRFSGMERAVSICMEGKVKRIRIHVTRNINTKSVGCAKTIFE